MQHLLHHLTAQNPVSHFQVDVVERWYSEDMLYMTWVHNMTNPSCHSVTKVHEHCRAVCHNCHPLPAYFILLILLEYAELWCSKITGFAEIPDLLLDKHEALKAEEIVILV